MTCSGCPQFPMWCTKDCFWEIDEDGKDGKCIGKPHFLGRHSLMADLMIWIFEGQLFSTLGCFPEKGFCDFQKSYKKMQIFSFASFS